MGVRTALNFECWCEAHTVPNTFRWLVRAMSFLSGSLPLSRSRPWDKELIWEVILKNTSVRVRWVRGGRQWQRVLRCVGYLWEWLGFTPTGHLWETGYSQSELSPSERRGSWVICSCPTQIHDPGRTLHEDWPPQNGFFLAPACWVAAAQRKPS